MIKLGHNLSFPETPKIPQQMCLIFLLPRGRKICDSVEVSPGIKLIKHH